MKFMPLVIAVFMASFLLSACGRSSPTSYYILDGSSPPAQQDIPVSCTLRVAMVNIPDYLNRNNIVSRKPGENRLVLADFHVWAEPLSNGIRRVTQVLLAAMLRKSKIDVIPNGSDQDADYVLELDIHRLDGNFGGNATLAAAWTLFGKNASAITGGEFVGQAPVSGSTYDMLVNVESQLIRSMADDIAPEIASAIGASKR